MCPAAGEKRMEVKRDNPGVATGSGGRYVPSQVQR